MRSCRCGVRPTAQAASPGCVKQQQHSILHFTVVISMRASAIIHVTCWSSGRAVVLALACCKVASSDSSVCAQAALNPARALGPFAVFHCYGGVHTAPSACCGEESAPPLRQAPSQHAAHRCTPKQICQGTCRLPRQGQLTAPPRLPALPSAGKIWVYILGEMAGGACAGLLSWPLCEWDICRLRCALSWAEHHGVIYLCSAQY
jgi:hypothetical protein